MPGTWLISDSLAVLGGQSYTPPRLTDVARRLKASRWVAGSRREEEVQGSEWEDGIFVGLCRRPCVVELMADTRRPRDHVRDALE